MKTTLLCLAAALVLGTVPTTAGAAAGSVRTGLSGVRWDPCRTVTYSISGHGYVDSSADIRHAARVMSRHSGIRLVQTARDNADIALRWTSAARNPFLRGYVVGATSTMSIEHDGVDETVGGWIDLDRTAHLRHGFPAHGAPAWGQVYLHELGHALGLSHVGDRRQIMSPYTSRYNHVLGRGDLHRLHEVGRAAGCIPDSMR